MFEKHKERREANRIQREKEKREAEELRLQILADKEVLLAEMEELSRSGSIGFGELTTLLKKGELGIFEAPATFMEGRAIRTGGYAGTRVRVAKGLSFNVGGFEAESHQELRVIDEGTLTLTSKRILFTGSKRTVSINLDKVIKVISYNHQRPAIAVNREGLQKTQYFFTAEADIPMEVEERTYVESLTGQMLVWIIEGAIERLNR